MLNEMVSSQWCLFLFYFFPWKFQLQFQVSELFSQDLETGSINDVVPTKEHILCLSICLPNVLATQNMKPEKTKKFKLLAKKY